MDYVFIFVHLLYIIFIFYYSYIFLKDDFCICKKANAKENNIDYSLFFLNNIYLDDYKLSQDFLKMKEKARKKFLLNNYKNMKYKNYEKQRYLLGAINSWRKSNKLNKFSGDKIKNIPECFMKQYTEVEINKDQNVFKLNNNLYLFKFVEGELIKKFWKKDLDSDMYNVLRNEELNHVKIVRKKEFEYIFFCKLSPTELFENNNLVL